MNMAPVNPSCTPLPAAGAASRAALIQSELETYVNPEKRDFLPRFFKTGKGEYGEGDQFLGIVVPDVRRVAKRYREEPQEVAACLLQSPWHECRLCALLMLVERFKKATPEVRKEVFDFYLTQTARINNWDLVDLSAPYIVGEYLATLPKNEDTNRYIIQTFLELAESPSLWRQRIAVVATHAFIRRGDFADITFLTMYFLSRQGLKQESGSKRPTTEMHDLMQKALGWMLREAGKRDKHFLEVILDVTCRQMPRTMLRYALEKFPPEERKKYMER